MYIYHVKRIQNNLNVLHGTNKAKGLKYQFQKTYLGHCNDMHKLSAHDYN